MFYLKMFKEWFKKVKTKIQLHFKVENLVHNLFGLLKISSITSIEIDKIYDVTKNPKRYKICILNCIISWTICLLHFISFTSDYMHSLIKSSYLPVE